MLCTPSAPRKDSVRGRAHLICALCSLHSAFCTFAALSQVYRPDCLAVPAAAGIYRGYMATLYSFGPFSAFYFGFYEQSKSVAVRWPPFPLVC